MSPGPSTPPAAPPSDFLADMVAEVAREVSGGLYDGPSPRARLRARRPPGLATAIKRQLEQQGSVGLIVELKHASPGYGEGALPALPPERFVEVAADGGACALSVIPQPHAFHGSLEEFAAVASRSRLPVLFKDFVISKRQVVAARAWGARAVLLLARLEWEGGLQAPLSELIDVAHGEGLEVLLEAHGAEDAMVARESRADVLGVNARDLRTLKVDAEEAVRTLRDLRGDPRPLVGMSGVASASDVQRYAAAGAHAVLVGTAFSTSNDPEAFLRGLKVPWGSSPPSKEGP